MEWFFKGINLFKLLVNEKNLIERIEIYQAIINHSLIIFKRGREKMVNCANSNCYNNTNVVSYVKKDYGGNVCYITPLCCSCNNSSD